MERWKNREISKDLKQVPGIGQVNSDKLVAAGIVNVRESCA
jgi:predicted flap endonuclease-1-like 5' DNA nuclease